MRAVLLRTDLLPYEEVADIFILDPDEYVIRLVRYSSFQSFIHSFIYSLFTLVILINTYLNTNGFVNNSFFHMIHIYMYMYINIHTLKKLN